MRRFLPVFSVVLLLASPAFAGEEPHHVEARLYSPFNATGNSDSIPAALELKMEEGWKTYWRTPGDAGLAPVLDWAGSENFKSADFYYPAPHRFITLDLDNFGYKGLTTFPLTITPEDKTKDVKLKLKLDLLVCKDICLPEKHELTLDLKAGDSVATNDEHAYRDALLMLPKKHDAGFKVDYAYLDYDSSNKNYIVIKATMPAKPSDKADLFVEHSSGLIFGKPDISYDADTHTTTFRAQCHATDAYPDLMAKMSTGGVTVTYTDGLYAAEDGVKVSERPEHADTPVKQPLSDKIRHFEVRFILLALLGGLILNLMPCVLPVLSLKVLSVVSHGGKDDKKTIFKNFMASAAGIVFSFWIMAAVLSSLKAAGQSIGWGLQFQHPAFLAFLAVTLLVFAANMWGLFEIPLPRFIAKHLAKKHEHEPTLFGHFLTGAFATLLATPCTAPFLGTAVGFAMAGGAFEIFTIFTCLGIGLALPYMALAVSPKLFKYMPKPGRWMVTLKRVLSIALLATAAWLVSILFTISATPALDQGWQKFDAALIAPAVTEGKTVVVDVTADWCLTCKANKKLVLETPEIEQALSEDNIVRLQADWTHRDEGISAFINKYGRYGIPFNIVYGPNAPEGIVLPELLTKEALLNALSEAAGE